METTKSLKYLEHLNTVLKAAVGSKDYIVVYGQNISAGSRISGLTKGFKVAETSKIINTTNTENSLIGFGFGVMLGGSKAAFFMKQLDFLFLGVDQLVNTYNLIRNTGHANGSFTILPVTVDMGYEGPQSSSNNLADFCSMARIDGFTLTNKYDIEKIIDLHFGKPGFRIISVSQRMYKDNIIDPGEPVILDDDMKFAQYKDGEDATIVTFNFAFPYGWQLGLELEKAGKKAAVFNVNYMTSFDWELILMNVRKTKRIVVIEDSKSENISAFSLMAAAEAIGLKKSILVRRKLDEKWLNPVSDKMDINYDEIVRELIS